MGLPTSPSDAAPAYDDVFHDHHHPVNRYPPSGSASGYATVPQNDMELEAGNIDTSASPAPAQQPESLAQTIAGVFRPKPHSHCEQCDVQLEARETRANERHCCAMVAATFMVAFICVMVLGIAITGYATKARKHGQD